MAFFLASHQFIEVYGHNPFLSVLLPETWARKANYLIWGMRYHSLRNRVPTALPTDGERHRLTVQLRLIQSKPR
jgi:hypothetical protein